jgi:hypothetical protein
MNRYLALYIRGYRLRRADRLKDISFYASSSDFNNLIADHAASALVCGLSG